jgi:hypothetical protein
VIRDRVRDEALAIAKACSHPEVDLRHVLWALIRVLGSAAPPEVPLAVAKALLGPAGTAYQTPAVSAAAETELSAITDEASAKAAILDLAKRLGPGGADAPGAKAPGTDDIPPSNEATPPIEPGTRDRAASGSTAAVTTATTTTDAGTPAAATGKEATDAILAELDALIGLAPVKAAVRRLIAVHLLNAERRSANLPEVDASLHVVFTGNPGTGKTTIARIIARLYGSIGLVSRGHLVEVSRADLVAGYVGQTALKVQAVVDRSVGGALFIDEAYALSFEGSGEFGAEAVAELVKLMEDHRDNLAVIVAGYPNEMRQFIESNPGLRSRFTHYIEFPDFSPSELVQVFERFASGAKVILGPGMGDKLEPMFRMADQVDNFGNARYARSIFERAYANMAIRVMADGKIERSEVDEMLVEDLPPADPFMAAKRPIGFRPR